MSEKIKQLSEKEKVRKKISVWLGSSNHIAVLHSIKELLGNSIDEINKGNGNRIKVTIDDPKTITFEDNCNGLPVEGLNEDGVENYKLLTQVLFAGSKYDNGIENNFQTVGTNGVFLTVLTYASEFVEYEVARPNGNIYSLKYYKGDEVDSLKVIGKSDRTYTKIKFTLDDEIFEENYYTYEEISQIADEQSSLIQGEIEVEDILNNHIKTFKYNDGIREFLSNKVNKANELTETISFKKEVSHRIPAPKTETTWIAGERVEREVKRPDKFDDIKMDIAIQYTKEDEDTIQIEFLNGSNLIHHGTIQDGFINGLRLVFNKYLKGNGLYKKNEKQITKDDILTGLNYVIDFRSYFPIFANQTKFASYVNYYKDVIQKVIEDYFESYSIENKFDMDKMANQILLNKRLRENSAESRTKLKKKLEEKVTVFTRPEKFVDCRSKDKKQRMLFILEGDSALGGAKLARDKNFHAIFPLKGKPVNVYKKKLKDVLSNDEVINLFRVMGGMEIKNNTSTPKFNIENLQYDKICILSDRDDDGLHIRTLVLALFYKFARPLIEQGKVFVVETPLFRIGLKNGKEQLLAYDNKQKDEITKGLNEKYTVQRFKGIGELDPKLLNQTAMNPETRTLIPITMKDVEAAEEILRICMNDDVEPRKKLIEEYGNELMDIGALV
ncbi:toprim domain-containing protein [Priestia sp. SB1]|uniref:toprim domain-containing protein n=1 Tax=Priestia sp. SB1 TaxID=3132359 RepID=UPI003176872A